MGLVFDINLEDIVENSEIFSVERPKPLKSVNYTEWFPPVKGEHATCISPNRGSIIHLLQIKVFVEDAGHLLQYQYLSTCQERVARMRLFQSKT